MQDAGLRIPSGNQPAVHAIFVNPTSLGALPGYYNSAYGVTATAAPSKRLYVSAGVYDGNGARGEQTGLRGASTINGYRFEIAEAGTAWLLGRSTCPARWPWAPGTRPGC